MNYDEQLFEKLAPGLCNHDHALRCTKCDAANPIMINLISPQGKDLSWMMLRAKERGIRFSILNLKTGWTVLMRGVNEGTTVRDTPEEALRDALLIHYNIDKGDEVA